jgi:hypothetical protein
VHTFKHYNVLHYRGHGCQGGGEATRLTADQLHPGSIPGLGLGDSGHSSGETPGLFPNPEVKPTHVLPCTELRERLGKVIRCYPLPYELYLFLDPFVLYPF